jgi:hypothetical protein
MSPFNSNTEGSNVTPTTEKQTLKLRIRYNTIKGLRTVWHKMRCEDDQNWDGESSILFY